MSAPNEDRQTDVAALAAGAVAVAVSMFLAPGPYDLLGAIVAVTMALIIWGYVWPHPRESRESVAVGALLGIVLIPIICFGWEAVATPWVGPRFNTQGQRETLVPDWLPAAIWIAGTTLISWWDYRRWHPVIKGSGAA
jgi:hypothetical protein